VIAAQIVNVLLEDGEDPKEFLDRNQDLRLTVIDNAFVQHGWAVRGPGEYGKVNDDGTVRWIVYLDDRSNRVAATFSGEKLFTDGGGREWRPFEIPDYSILGHGEGLDEFVTGIEDYLADFTGE
jgi:hypothetical protein